MAIQINSTSIKQPNADGLIEEYANYETTQVAINGGKQRTRAGQKKYATLNWNGCNIAEYQQLNTLLNSGAAVLYYNDTTNKPTGIFTFTGLPTFKSNSYWRGASLLVDCSVTIEEV
jgi:hypothetical protein